MKDQDKTKEQLISELDDLRRQVAELNEHLRQSHDELLTIYDGMIEGLLITDIETKRFVRVNHSMCRMLGYSEEELLAASIKDIHPPEEVPNDLQRFQAVAEGRVSINEDRPVLRKDGSVFYADITGHRVFYDERPCLLALFRDSTERKQAQEALRKEYQNLKHLLHASDHERQLIAYEIHDGLAQQLAAGLMQLQAFDHLKDKTPKDAAKAYDAAVTMLRQGHYEARRLIAGVRPPILDESGVAEAISHLVHEEGRDKSPKIEYRSRVDFGRMDPTLENGIYRIAQEALANACHYSKSERVQVNLVQHGDQVRIEVRDWGVGFDPKAIPKNHFGLEGIRQRARLLGGKCSIRSGTGKGTRITVDLPVVLRD
ncbi:MAG: PAS domain-containing sensor histidine kinase [Thermoguttaceae bacterium]|jgi:PAS domain S-box-containing protein